MTGNLIFGKAVRISASHSVLSCSPRDDTMLLEWFPPRLHALFAPLQVAELGKVSLGQLQDSFEPVVQVSSVQSRLKRCNIRFCLAGRTRAIARAQPALSQPASNEEWKVHLTISSSPGTSTHCNCAQRGRLRSTGFHPETTSEASAVSRRTILRRRRQTSAAAAWYRLDELRSFSSSRQPR
jgi:hypothetical protein